MKEEHLHVDNVWMQSILHLAVTEVTPSVVYYREIAFLYLALCWMLSFNAKMSGGVQ